MKIGIITFTNTVNNYGQVLQAYALQEYLRKRGHEVFHIRYSSANKKKKGKVTFPHTVREMKTFLRSFLVKTIIKPYRNYEGKKFEKKNPRDFRLFVDQHINFYSKLFTNLTDIQENFPEADAYVCGSDQIWHTGTGTESEPFYLNFGDANTLRIAYAPSFGRAETTNDYNAFLRKQLKRFDLIGVREESGVKICRDAGRSDAVHVIDPTLLLTKVEYSKLYLPHDYKWNSKHRLMAYFLNYRHKSDIHWKEIIQFVNEEACEFRLTISSGAYPARDILGWNDYFSPSPSEWLYSISEADYFLTNSFHGTAFAIIFHKQFIVMPVIGNNASMNDRVFSLLKSVNLSDRMFVPGKSIKEQLIKPIDWNAVERQLQYQRDFSNDFFKQKNI